MIIPRLVKACETAYFLMHVLAKTDQHSAHACVKPLAPPIGFAFLAEAPLYQAPQPEKEHYFYGKTLYKKTASSLHTVQPYTNNAPTSSTQINIFNHVI